MDSVGNEGQGRGRSEVTRGRRALALAGGLLVAGFPQLAVGRPLRGAVSFLTFYLLLAAACAGALEGRWPLMALASLAALLVRGHGLLESIWLRPGPTLPSLALVILVGGGLGVATRLGAGAVRVRLLEAFRIPAGSMWPTLEVGDQVMVDNRRFEPVRGDVIVFQYPVEPDKSFIKRVVGVAGDRLELDGEVLRLNGQPVARQRSPEACRLPAGVEPDEAWAACVLYDETLPRGRRYQVADLATPARRGYRHLPITVPPGHVYVIGDNRDNSHDSRFWGPVPLGLVKGRAIMVWWSAGPAGPRWSRLGRPVR
jgi:signal peptidase I